MELELLKIISEYSRNKKIADEDFIKRTLAIIIKYNHLETYIKEVCFKAASDNYSAIMGYDPLLKEITIFKNQLSQELDLEIGMMQEIISLKEIDFLYNLIITQNLLHEAEHAKQERQVFSNNTSLETQLLKIFNHEQANFRVMAIIAVLTNDEEYKQQLIEQRNKQMEYYQYSLTERLAQLKSYTITKKIITPLREELLNLFNLEEAFLLMQYLKGYDETERGIEAPTMKYLSQMNHLSELKNFEFYDSNYQQLTSNIIAKYNFLTRLNLGLPLTITEYQKFQTLENKKRKQLSKKIIC